MLKLIHGADFHLDSPYRALSPEQAVLRRREGRQLVERLADYANAHAVDLVLLAGDLFDGSGGYPETATALFAALGTINAPVFIAPGNHDPYPTAYAGQKLPENVHVFSHTAIERVELPGLHAAVYGGAFVSETQERGLLDGFAAEEDGLLHLMVLHGDLNASEARYNPITREEIAASGLNYLALGHVHRRSEPLRLGRTVCAYPGCLEGRGFDELGDKGFYEGVMDDDGEITLTFVPFAPHRYERLTVEVAAGDPAAALEAVLPPDTQNDLYRVTFTGETDEDGVNLTALQERLAPRFYQLELRDETRVREELWARAEEDSLRGLFLRELQGRLKEPGVDEEKITRAVRFGLAALDRRDLL
ncbi:MAG: DNA repair exonuclease [Oscillospiraceae bacterium]